jgi:hypothetical protein
MIAFCVFAVRLTVPDHYVIWLFLLFFSAAATGGIALYVLLDRATQRVQQVAVGHSHAPIDDKAAGLKGKRAPGQTMELRGIQWEIGPRGARLAPHWIITLICASVSAVVLASQLAFSGLSGYAPNYGALVFCFVCGVIALAVWTTVVRFRIDGPVVTIERPCFLFGRTVSFYLSEIERVDLTHFPHDRRYGKCLTIKLSGGRRIKYSEGDRVIAKVVRKLRLAIEGLQQDAHPLSDEAIR